MPSSARPTSCAITVADLRTRAGSVFHEQPQKAQYDPARDALDGPSDFQLNPGMLEEVDRPIKLTPAAVLIPIVAHDELSVILTQRTKHLSKHAGQISFPGGRIDDTDAGPVAAALRETEEEIGLDAGHISPLGFLDTYVTRTQYAVSPVAALVEPGFTLQPNPKEVADIFEVPLSFLLDPGNLEAHELELNGKRRRFFALNYQDRFIWGATAGMIKNLHERLFGE